ncbi:DNA mismatch repair endonuclease MutL [Geminocystis sp. NIES-3709]|uniref:DNA mismatch repair endonuclease MutL n=1 Tax=Geminocystis sp. NIES-3709 TaxID=1617448 RepID=UPI0005FCA5F1|nr:DNA mismatch repair endonuclease MutL [Geminocystis sp. NIES-3709]BAQ64548.1 DNA mismatch repair protein MutL [Geminocystis sp. NIES-3709]
MSIKKLPDNVIKLIAAGEVIDSLTAVVRELVENSLDAKASRIVISLYPDSWSLQVADNGEGMEEEDLLMAIQPHTTSKINSTDDLTKIQTLGFRGEALHSIAQLADLNITSRVKDSCGWEIITHQTEIIKCYPKAIAVGTIIHVSNLFANIPLRRQLNPCFKKQLKSIQILISDLALCHPQVTWQLLVDDRVILAISGNNYLKKIFPQLLKTVKYSDLEEREIKINTPNENNISILNLIIGLPDRISRPRNDWVRIGVNGRVVKCPELESAIYSSFHRTLERDRYPIIFLHLQTSPQQIDWNRHPAKAEIYLDNIEFWQENIKQNIEQIFKLTDNNISARFENKKLENIFKVAENRTIYNVDNSSQTIAENKNGLGLIELQVISQARNTYIIAEYSHGIWLIEQHIAHERILYEQLKNQWKIVSIDNPIILNNLRKKQVENLANLSLEIESFGEDLWAIRSIPQALLNRDDCLDALIELSWGGDIDSAQVSIACRTAIRNGKKLTISEMQTIVNEWKITKNPHTCPHGRPIYLSLEESSLYRFFRRHWVLGKSHGITEK